MFRYKIDVIEELKKHGYNTTRIIRENIIGQASMQNIRQNKMIGLKTLGIICDILNCDIGDIIEYVKEES